MAYKASISGVEITIKSVIDKIKSKGIKLNFLVATPIVEIMTLFKASFDEVRTGVTRFKVRLSAAKRALKRDATGAAVSWVPNEKERTQNISQYGLSNHHIPLIQGITFAPERRPVVLKSLGPLTQAILLVLEDKYYNKLTSALNYSIQMFPMSNEICNFLRERRIMGQQQE